MKYVVFYGDNELRGKLVNSKPAAAKLFRSAVMYEVDKPLIARWLESDSETPLYGLVSPIWVYLVED